MRPSIFLLLSASIAFGCDGDGGTPSLVQAPPPDRVEAQMIIDSRGGVVAVSDRSSPLFGATVHVPPGAVSTSTMISIAQAELPPYQNTHLAGPAIELLPSGAMFATDVTIVIPVYDGMDAVTVQGAFIDEDRPTDPWEVIASSQSGYADPAAEIGPQVNIRVDHFTTFAPVFLSTPGFGVVSDLHGTDFDIEVLATRPLSDSVHGFTFRTNPAGELGAWARAGFGTTASLRVLEGEYLVRATATDGSEERCAVGTAVRMDPGTRPLTMITAASPACDLPPVTLTATSQVVMRGETVELSATATAPVGDRLNYYWNRTGGTLADREGEMGDGETVTTTWTAPRVGTWDVYFTAYDQGTGLFGEARATIVVRGNEPPEVTSVLATPRNIAQGADEGARSSVPPMSSGDALAGLTLLTAEATDPDGDEISYFWYHGLPGNYYDPLSGIQLGRDGLTGNATDPSTTLPFTGPAVLYMAPQASFLCEGFPLGMYLGLHVTASDGNATDRSWAMVGMECVEAEPPPSSNEGKHCYFASWWGDPAGRPYCYGQRSNFDWIPAECASEGAAVGNGPCPNGSLGGACIQTDSEGYHSVRYGIDAAEAEDSASRCAAADERWEYPYSP